MVLSASQIDRLGRILVEAASLAPESQADFVNTECSDDPQVRDEVHALLASLKRSDGYFEKLAAEMVTPGLLAAAFDREEEAIPVGEQISHYEILGKAGRGGMGIVYKARDLRLSRTVALKFLPPRHASNPLARARLLAEAQAASALDHPNIGTVYEIGETDIGRSFIALAWYEGEALKDKVRRGSIPHGEVVDISLQLATGLSAAHAAGVIHRDVKPANVVLTRNGVAKLVDFGIAKFTTEDAVEIGTTVGTPAYMSPEQTLGEHVDARSDIWSLGVLMYEMLTGCRPFEGRTESSLIESIQSEGHIAASARRQDVPVQLSAIVDRCLSKDPALRYSTAGEVCDALRHWSASPALRPSMLRRNRPFVAALILIAVVAVAAASRELALRSGDSRSASASPSVRHTVAVFPFSNGNNNNADEHLVNGFTDGLIETLGRLEDLKVPAKASASGLLRQGVDPLAVGRQLAADAIVRGDFRRDGDRYVVGASLVNTADGRVLWAKQYDRPATDAFALQNEIAQLITKTLRPGDSRPQATIERKPPTRDLQAYELYLKGRFAWNQRTREKLEESLAYFRGALERDPDFAEAHAGMSAAYINMSNFGWMPSAEALSRAEVAADRAIAIDSALADARAARGFALASRGAFRESEAEFKKGIELNPSFSWTYHYYALLLTDLGRVDEAIDNLRATLALDPLSLPANATLGILEGMKGQKAESRRQFAKALALSPEFQLTLYYVGIFDAAEQNNAESIKMLEKALKLSPGFPGVRASLATVYRRVGRLKEAAALERDLVASASDERSRINLALGYAVLGKVDTAFAMMKKAEWDVPTLFELRANPLLAGFRSDPRYSELIKGIERGR
jgi:serine/threonine protein kinase/tetratricopeptide (TPR) repeat protein